jgi:hypothetical protein
MFKTIGIVNSTRRWVYLACDDQLGEYYRSLIKVNLLNLKCDYNNKMWPKLQKSVWSTHVSIVRLQDFESLPKETIDSFWNKWNGMEIEITYQSTMKTNGTYFWLPVDENEQLNGIRLELGLPKNPTPNYHLTIGNLIGTVLDEKD